MKRSKNRTFARMVSLAVALSLLLSMSPVRLSAESDGLLHGIITDSSYNTSLASFSPDDPENVTLGSPVPADDYITAAEYYHGNYYCYSNGLFHVYSADSFELLYVGGESQGVMFADMSFDYSSGKMYALIADSYVSSMCVYEVDMLNGDVTMALDTTGMTDSYGNKLALCGIACSADGTIYACDSSLLYTLDIENGTCSPIGSMLVPTQNSSMYYQSLAFDHYTGTLYLAATYNDDNFSTVSDLYSVDTANGTSTLIGSIGNGCSLVGLNCAYVPADLPPVEPAGVIITLPSAIIQAGSTMEISAAVATNPAGFANDFEILSTEWSSDNENVVMVDDGTVTAVSPGEAHIAVTIETELGGTHFTVSGEVLITVSERAAADVTIHAIDTYPPDSTNMFEVVEFDTTLPAEAETEFGCAGSDFANGTAYWNGYIYYCTTFNALYRVRLEAGSSPELITGALPSGYDSLGNIMVNPVDGQAYAISCKDTWYFTLLRLDLETGAIEDVGMLENIGEMLYGSGLRAITIDESGRCYAIACDSTYGLYTDNKLYEIDLNTANGTYICDVDIEEFYSGNICYSEEAGCFYAVSGSSNGGYMLYEIDPESGTTKNLGICDQMGHVKSIYIVDENQQECAVTFVDGSNGEVINTANVAPGTVLEPGDFPTPPVHDGLEFVGWDYDYTPIFSDITITAEYSCGGSDYELGDVNMNGSIEPDDALLTLRAFMGLFTLEPEQEALADINENGDVNADDALLILRRALNI